MKVLRGSLKGRNIKCPPNIRPVSLRVKKSCFDILSEEIEDKKVLDLFAGSGALGIEALSRGAKEAVFVDIKRGCIDILKKALFSFKIASMTHTYVKDAFGAVKDFSLRKEAFDIIFLDPPYYKGMLRKALQTLEEYDILTPAGFIVGFCYKKDDLLLESGIFFLILSKEYGQTLLLIYRKQ